MGERAKTKREIDNEYRMRKRQKERKKKMFKKIERKSKVRMREYRQNDRI